MVAALGETMRQVNAAILGHGGFSTRMMPAYAVHAYDDPAIDPRPTGKCNAFMRTYCRPDSPNRNNTFTYVNTSAIRVQYSDECVDLRPGAQRHRRPHSNRGRATPFTLHLGSRGQADGLCTALIVLTSGFLTSALLLQVRVDPQVYARHLAHPGRRAGSCSVPPGEGPLRVHRLAVGGMPRQLRAPAVRTSTRPLVVPTRPP